MEQTQNQEVSQRPKIKSAPHVSDAPVTLKRMRELKGWNRKEAGIKVNLTHKTIEKLENARGNLDEIRLVAFADAYGFNTNDLFRIRTGTFDTDLTVKNRPKEKTYPLRRDRRFCTLIITKKCKVLRQMREDRKDISQYKLSAMCGYGKRRICFYERGRKNLDDKLIKFIIGKMNYTMDDFNRYMEMETMPYEVIGDCNKMMEKLDIKTLKAVRSFLQGFTN